jgi:hypothetical protein
VEFRDASSHVLASIWEVHRLETTQKFGQRPGILSSPFSSKSLYLLDINLARLPHAMCYNRIVRKEKPCRMAGFRFCCRTFDRSGKEPGIGDTRDT